MEERPGPGQVRGRQPGGHRSLRDVANPALARGEIGYAGNNVTDVKSNFLDVSPNNHTWTPEPPYFASNNVVALWLNVTKPPLNDVKVRLAISAGINRQQLSAQGESGYAPPATSSGGLLLPADKVLLHPSYVNDLAATSDRAKVTQFAWAVALLLDPELARQHADRSDRR